MIGLALTLITYIWHYVLARLVYDQLVRPAIHGRLTAILLICGVAGSGLLAWRWWRRRRVKRVAAPSSGRQV